MKWWRSNGFSDDRGGSFLSIVGRRALKLWWDHLSPDCLWMANAKLRNTKFLIASELMLTHIHRVLFPGQTLFKNFCWWLFVFGMPLLLHLLVMLAHFRASAIIGIGGALTIAHCSAFAISARCTIFHYYSQWDFTFALLHHLPLLLPMRFCICIIFPNEILH